MPWTGALRLHDLTERMGLTLPDGDYETVAGFLLDRIGSIPSEGSAVQVWQRELHHHGDGWPAGWTRLRIHYMTPFGAEEPQSAGDR